MNFLNVFLSLLDTLTSALLRGDFDTIRAILEIILTTTKEMLPKVKRGRFTEMMSKMSNETTKVLNKLTNGTFGEVKNYVSSMKEKMKQTVTSKAKQVLS